MIPNQRHLFDIPDDVAYFNCSSHSPLLRKSVEAGQAAVMRKAHPPKIVVSQIWLKDPKLDFMPDTLTNQRRNLVQRTSQ